MVAMRAADPESRAPESQSLAPTPETVRRPRDQIAFTLFLGIIYIVISAGLINYNKFLIHKERFPFALGLVLIHSGFCSLFTGALYVFKPSLFPSLANGFGAVDKSMIYKGAFPVAILFSGQLVLSNAPYLHASVAFLQMMKESNLVLVYIFSLLFALEKFSHRNVTVLAVILVATTMTIHGEMNFSMVGFTMQAMSQLFESLKIVLQAMLLSQAGKKLDALTYVLFVMPCCFCILGLLTLFLKFVHPLPYLATPDLAHVVAWWPHLLANACVAFALNVSVAVFVKHSSAIAFILAGITKDAMIVLSMCLFMKEIVSLLQFIGFALQLSCVLLWSMMKVYPKEFEDGICIGLLRIICGVDSAKVNSKKKSEYGAVTA